MIFQSENSEFWCKKDIPKFDPEDFQDVEVTMGVFSKTGQTLKKTCHRTYFIIRDILLYSNQGKGAKIKGYVRLNTIYLSFHVQGTVGYIKLVNGTKTHSFFTGDLPLYESWTQILMNKCILSDFESHYELKELIGTGAFSQVYRCQDSLGQEYAVKIIIKQTFKSADKNKQFQRQLHNEISCLRQVDHPHIVKLYRVYESQTKLYLVTEMITNGEIISVATSKKIYEGTDVLRFIYNVLGAMMQLEDLKVMHRDMKPQNIMIRNGQLYDPCLIDFGLCAFEYEETPPFPQCGSAGYSAPEIIKYEIKKKMYNCKCDMFSFGVILFVMLFGYNPFKSQDQKSTLKKNQEAIIQIPTNPPIPKQLESLLLQMTKRNPKERITPMDALNHMIFKIDVNFQFSMPRSIMTMQQYEIYQKSGHQKVVSSAEIGLDSQQPIVQLKPISTSKDQFHNYDIKFLKQQFQEEEVKYDVDNINEEPYLQSTQIICLHQDIKKCKTMSQSNIDKFH